MSSFENQLQQVTELISLPEVYLKFRSLMQDPHSVIDDFTQVISLDPNLTVKLLNAINSAYFGFAGQINSVSRAINMLGLGQLHTMVLGISALSALDFPNDIVPLKTFWRTSLLTGTLARQLGEQSRSLAGDKLFIIGLLHEIGHLVLYAEFPDLARKTRQVAKENNLPVQQAEQQVLGCHYGEIGAKLMHQWSLPDDFQRMTRLQPTPELAEQDSFETALLHIAHAYAHKHAMEVETELNDLIAPITWETGRITPKSVEQAMQPALMHCTEMEQVILA